MLIYLNAWGMQNIEAKGSEEREECKKSWCKAREVSGRCNLSRTDASGHQPLGPVPTATLSDQALINLSFIFFTYLFWGEATSNSSGLLGE